jgi:Mitochondrial resolvase Ydc2 / RNA splicing MRS1
MSRRILSFDVGIKNLSLCYLEQQDTSGGSYKILEWKVVNLMEAAAVAAAAATPPPTCSCEIKKAGKKPAHPCGKQAKYMWRDQPFCERHAKAQPDVIIPKKFHEVSWLNKQKNAVLEDLYGKTGGQEPRPRTKKDLAEYLAKYYQERSFQSIGVDGGPGVTASELDLITIGRHMASHLDRMFREKDPPTHVIIENQISTIAARMMTIQGELTMYFLIHYPGIHIEFISPKNKLKMGSPEGATQQDTSAKVLRPGSSPQQTACVPISDRPASGLTYKERKNNAIEFTKKILGENLVLRESWLPFFMNERKKKDDLADCFLQGLWFMKHKLSSS